MKPTMKSGMPTLLFDLLRQPNDGHHRHDPQHPGHLDGGADVESPVPVDRGGPHHAADVVDGQTGPDPEAVLAEVQEMADHREEEKRHRVEGENRRQGDGHVLVFGLDHRRHGGDGAAAANRRAEGDQARGLFRGLAGPAEKSRRRSG